MFYKGKKKRDERIHKQIMSNPRNDISKRTINDIENEIKSINVFLLQVESLSTKELFERFSNLITGHSRTPYNMRLDGAFRARINENGEEFITVQDLWYPDWASIDKKKYRFGRCNNKGESIFYCSTDLNTSIVEIRPKLNDIITTIDYRPTRNRREVVAKTNPIGITYLQKIKQFGDTFADHFKQKNGLDSIFTNNFILDNFLNEKFHEVINEEENWKYKISIAISEILLYGDFEGLLYPSISYKMNQANFAFKPEFADLNFCIKDGYMWRITEVVNNNSYALEKIKQLDEIHFCDPNNFKNARVYWRNPRDNDKDIVRTIEY